MEVLVVDDETISRRMIAHTLSEAGYEVTTVTDGKAALDTLRQGRHQLVVSDWEMPRMNGIELCKAVRDGNFRRYVYVIVLTSHGRPQDMIKGLSAGADDFVTKPFDPAELVMRVHTGRRVIGLETRDMTIFALATLAESRDSETRGHLERVQRYSRILAAHLQDTDKYRDVIDGEYLRLIYQTTPLHDIGKVAVPDFVLLKPGRLTEREFEIMKTHTTQGAATLELAMEEFPNVPFLQIARDITLSHHEKYDGSGYPRGLVGEDIPLCARIMALADVYDALTSQRVYKEAFSHDVAKSIIIDEKGKHFDPDVVAAFLAEEKRFIAVSKVYGGKARAVTKQNRKQQKPEPDHDETPFMPINDPARIQTMSTTTNGGSLS